MSRRRVVMLDHTAALGGAEIALARLVPAVDRDRYDIVVLVFAEGPLTERLRADGVNVRVLPLDPAIARRSRHDMGRSPRSAVAGAWSTARFALTLARELRRLEAEVVHANSLKSFVIGAIATRRAGVPLVWHLHDRLSADYMNPRTAQALRLLGRLFARQVVVNSDATRATLGAFPRERVAVAYPGLPAGAFHRHAQRSSSGDRRVVGLIGRISPTKGQAEFIRAAARVAAERPDTVFRVVGAALFDEADYESAVRVLPAELGIADRVELTGWVDDAATALRGLDLLVHASPTPEPFGQVVVEAMAAGVPVVGTRAGGVVEILDPGRALATGVSIGTSRTTALGRLVEPGDVAGLAAAISAALDDPGETAAMAERAWHSARERFAIGAAADVVTGCWDRAAVMRRSLGEASDRPLPAR